MHNILITGGAGFIGSALCKKLVTDGNRVVVIDPLTPQVHGHGIVLSDPTFSNDAKFLRVNMREVQEYSQDLIDSDIYIHLAAETGTGQSQYKLVNYYETNLVETARFLEAISLQENLHEKKIILASSRSVYGEGAYKCHECETMIFPKTRSIEVLKNKIWDPVCEKCGNTLLSVATDESAPLQTASIYAATKQAQ